jgi:hypothetical protein
MRAGSFSPATLPQFSAGASAVQRHRQDSGKHAATRTQRTTQKGAGAATTARCRPIQRSTSHPPRAARTALAHPSFARHAALTPPGTLIRLGSKNLLKTGAWAYLRVRVKCHGRARDRSGAAQALPRHRRFVPRHVHFGVRRTAPLEFPPAVRTGTDRLRGMGLAGSGGCPAPGFGAREESQR